VTALVLALMAPGAARAQGKAAHPGAESVRTHKDSHAKKSKRVRRHEPAFTGWTPPASQMRTAPLPRPSGQLRLTSANFHGETLDVNLYNPDGSFNDDTLDQLYHFWRCRRTGTEKPIDPRLFELLSIIYDRFHQPIELVSGFRNQDHVSSYHFHGSASDIRIPGVSDSALQQFAATLDGGHMGLGRYPRAGFVHVDVRPASYRWIDRSPPSENMGHPKRARHHNT
jgi:uncharacterized protein YcbK (DUF882 family)